MKKWCVGLTAVMTIISTGGIYSAGEWETGFRFPSDDQFYGALRVKGEQGEMVKFMVKNSKKSNGQLEYEVYVKNNSVTSNRSSVLPLASGTIQPGNDFKGGQISRLDGDYVLSIRCVPMKEGEPAECIGRASLESKRVSTI